MVEGISTAKFTRFCTSSTKLHMRENCVIVLPVSILMGMACWLLGPHNTLPCVLIMIVIIYVLVVLDDICDGILPVIRYPLKMALIRYPLLTSVMGVLLDKSSDCVPLDDVSAICLSCKHCNPCHQISMCTPLPPSSRDSLFLPSSIGTSITTVIKGTLSLSL